MIIKSFTGIKNTTSIRDVQIAEALDVDLDDKGVLLARRGFVKRQDLTGITAAYSSQEQQGFVVANGTLYLVNKDATVVPLCASTATDFCDNGKVTFTNDGLRIEGSQVFSVKMPKPDFAPSLIAISGEMPKGRYSATYTYINGMGMESGSAPIATIELKATGGIAVADIVPPTGYKVRLYLTETNGTVFYDRQGVQLEPMAVLTDNFPENVDKIAFHDSRLYVSTPLEDDTAVFFSEAFYWHFWNFVDDYFIVPGKVLGMMGSSGGLVIVTDSDMYLYADKALAHLADYGAVPGHPISALPDKSVLIHSTRGVCKFPDFKNVTEQNVSLIPGEKCASAYISHSGFSQFLVVHDGEGEAYNQTFEPSLFTKAIATKVTSL